MEYWVIDGKEYQAKIDIKEDIITFYNGLIKRELNTKNCSTTSIYNVKNDIEYIDAPFSDAFLLINGQTIDIGKSFNFVNANYVERLELVPFKPSPTMTGANIYPPDGKAVEIVYDSPLLSLKAIIHYEIYDGVPTIMKQIFVENYGNNAVIIDNIKVDALKIVNNRDMFFVDSNFNSASDFLGLNFDVYAKLYARYSYDVLEVAPIYKMNVVLEPKSRLDSIIAFESCFCSKYYEQKLIEVKAIYRILAPWSLDNVLFFHLISNNSACIKDTVDECVEVGLEMIIQSFGSGVNMESKKVRYLNRIKKAYDYGHTKGIRMGAYTLAYVKNYSPVNGDEAINHDKSHICRCLATEWAKTYMSDVINFLDKTGADAIEIDGPYGMQLCSGGKTHLHSDFTDSQYLQWKMSIVDWYRAIKSRNVYINAPDWHFINGTNRTGVGYEEISFSEKRAEQLVTSRIYYYKGTFSKNPSQSWGFVPLNVYHGGGSDAKFCPTDVNHKEYDWALAQIVASGVWPILRGKKVYDSEKGRDILKHWVTVFKKYRKVLNGITVHFLPPIIDKNDPTKTVGIDAIMNQLPEGEDRGFLMFFNQTDKAISKKVKVPVYYTGLTELKLPPPPYENTKNCDIEYPIYGVEATPLVILARDGKSRTYITDAKVEETIIPSVQIATLTGKKIVISQFDKQPQEYFIDTEGNITIDITLLPMTYHWYVLHPAL